jgi:hypothetical protein
MLPGLPKLTGPFLPASIGINKLNMMVQRELEIAEKDNSLIYFQSVPMEEEIPALPAAALIMTRPTYSEPRQGAFVKFRSDLDESSAPSSSASK